MVKPTNTAAIEKATGRSWDDWVALLDGEGARELPHPEIAGIAIRHLDAETGANNGWWAQSIAVAYEQHIGRRLPGQRPDGTFEGSASRTVAGRRDDVARAWGELILDHLAEHGGIGGVALEGDARTTDTGKRAYWRSGFTDGTRVAVSFEDKGADKVLVTATHERIAAPDDVADWKAAWKAVLAGF
ncbi:hypothetical protein [Zhihengliuella salsuginis]|uniref:DUF4287 domain-containing protein n=1 Tax=Zhihengliuella salsuginis TaxID=578222 RepID=A0ABQ3GJ92_9MICC|nr:hypothetical protein [Zhihengliuella salsuginis]GHD06701.1 hypothetical protein GCM10008096_16970 [Zhihengliuella salsuginis]